ncbi:MAG: hypothetical protein ACRCS4_07295, partial [Flavobacterium sp.]
MKEDKTKAQESNIPVVLTQKDVPSMLELVTKQINTLKGGLPKEASTSTANLDGFGKVSSIDTVETLIKAASVVLAKQKAYNEAAKEVLPEIFKVPPFSINGHSAAQWISDIKDRILVVANKAELEKLEKVKSTLEAHLSAEDKLAKDLLSIANLLGEGLN